MKLLTLVVFMLFVAAFGCERQNSPAPISATSIQPDAPTSPAPEIALSECCRELRDYLPMMTVQADLMAIGAPRRLTELIEKSKQHGTKTPEELREQLRTSGGDRLPYDPRLGITEAEFNELFALFDQLELHKVETVPLQIERKGNIVALSGGERLPVLNQIQFNLEKCSLITPFGETDLRDPIEASDEQKMTGPWNGVEWVLRSTSPRVSIRLSLGTHQETGRGILYYNCASAPGESIPSTVLFLYFDK